MTDKAGSGHEKHEVRQRERPFPQPQLSFSRLYAKKGRPVENFLDRNKKTQRFELQQEPDQSFTAAMAPCK